MDPVTDFDPDREFDSAAVSDLEFELEREFEPLIVSVFDCVIVEDVDRVAVLESVGDFDPFPEIDVE